MSSKFKARPKQMDQIKDSLNRIKVASATLENNIKTPTHSDEYIRNIHQVLTELSNGVETLKEEVQCQEHSPIRFKK